MSFGVVQSAISSIKNNRNLISKRKKLKDSLGGYDAKEKSKFNFPEATPQMIKEL
jgi:hypothetical protein